MDLSENFLKLSKNIFKRLVEIAKQLCMVQGEGECLTHHHMPGRTKLLVKLLLHLGRNII